ncbi:MAG: ABC transporter permease [Deltaproteobacteria bacterium]|nr:MAG: ABC transporter permease [Deltaproteobacteria bacterium]
MEAVANIFEYAGGITLLFFQTIRHTFKRPFPLALTVQQIEAIGVRSLTVVNVIALFTGMVLALQTAEVMTRFGAKGYIGVVVALSMLREIGPVFTAIMVGGRVGSGIAAELGSMQVTEQIDAMRVMGAHPVRKLVVPRVIATTLVLPMLTVIADILGIFGGLLISIVELKVNAYYYFHTILENITFSDIFSGLGKTFFFGFLIAIIGCYQGLTTTGGTQGVGSSTTRTVVLISIAVLIADFLLTKLFMLL